MSTFFERKGVWLKKIEYSKRDGWQQQLVIFALGLKFDYILVYLPPPVSTSGFFIPQQPLRPFHLAFYPVVSARLHNSCIQRKYYRHGFLTQ